MKIVIAIAFSPIKIVIHSLREYLIEYIRALSNFKIKKFQNKNKLFTDCFY